MDYNEFEKLPGGTILVGKRVGRRRVTLSRFYLQKNPTRFSQ